MTPRNIILVDDHTLFAKALKTLIASFENTYVTYVAQNGLDFIEYIKKQNSLPDVVLLDVRMPGLDGIGTMQWLSEHLPQINVLAITMEDDDQTISQMIRYGCKGYLLKDVAPQKLEKAIATAAQGRYVYSERVDKQTFKRLKEMTYSDTLEEEEDLYFKDSELEFLRYICGTDLNSKEIALRMNLSPSTIDNRRTELYKKLGVNNRISAILFAMEHNLLS
ncbi:MAG: response regulator transcription factor [Dokdonia sp.]|jgi:DNA-binding NarL/FixJ family response regulator